MPNISLTAPVDAQQAAINRKRALAQALQQMSMEPLQAPPVAGAKISPLEGIAKLVQALAGSYQNKKLDGQQAALSGQEQASRTAGADSLANAVTPQPQGLTVPMATPQEAQIPGDNAVPAMASPPIATQMPVGPGQVDQRAQSIKALASALSSSDPVMQESGKTLLQSLLTGGREQKAAVAESAQHLGDQQFQASQSQAAQTGENYRQGRALSQAADIANQKDTSPLIVPTGAVALDKATGQPLYSNPDKPPAVTAEQQKITDFNNDSALTKKYGSGTVGYEKWQQDQRVQAASAGAAARQDAIKSNDPRLANVDQNAQKDVLDKVQKIESTYNSARRAQDDMNSVVESAKSGNKVSAAYSPVLGVLEINTANGTKRINRNEIEMYAGAGSAFDRIAGWVGKGVEGQPIPPNILNDMKSLSDTLAKNAQTLHDRDLQSVDSTYRSTFAPKTAAVRKYNPATGKIE